MNKSSNLITFSILSPSYNKADYLEEAIESVIVQTYPYWELIIVDDASTDNSVDKIKSFLKDKRIKLIFNKNNKGAGYTERVAAKHASNMIFCMLDLDDALHRSALEIIAKEYRENPDYGLIYSSYWICDPKLRIIKVSEFTGPVDPKKTNLIERKTSHLITFRKEIYEQTNGFNPKFKMNNDADICFKLEEVAKLKFINIPLYYYRINKTGVSIRNKFQVELENYIAKLDAYYRRLNTNIPNMSFKDLHFEYYKIKFFKIVLFFTFLKEYFRISKIMNKIFIIFLILPEKITVKLRSIKKKYFYWF